MVGDKRKKYMASLIIMIAVDVGEDMGDCPRCGGVADHLMGVLIVGNVEVIELCRACATEADEKPIRWFKPSKEGAGLTTRGKTPRARHAVITREDHVGRHLCLDEVEVTAVPKRSRFFSSPTADRLDRELGWTPQGRGGRDLSGEAPQWKTPRGRTDE